MGLSGVRKGDLEFLNCANIFLDVVLVRLPGSNCAVLFFKIAYQSAFICCRVHYLFLNFGGRLPFTKIPFEEKIKVVFDL